MDQKNLVAPSSLCWNPACSEYGNVDAGNIRKFGRTPAGTQRYQCKTCRQTLVETIGTVFYGRHRSQETILECLAMLADRNSLASIHRITCSSHHLRVRTVCAPRRPALPQRRLHRGVHRWECCERRARMGMHHDQLGRSAAGLSQLLLKLHLTAFH